MHAQNLLADVGVILHVLEKVVLLALFIQPGLALNLVQKLDVGRVKVVDAPDEHHRHPAHAEKGQEVEERVPQEAPEHAGAGGGSRRAVIRWLRCMFANCEGSGSRGLHPCRK